MRLLVAALGISMVSFGALAQASDDLSLPAAGLAPLGDAMLAMTTGGMAPSRCPPASTTSSRTASLCPSLSEHFAVTGVTGCSDRAGPLD